jgi:hypothetical protein
VLGRVANPYDPQLGVTSNDIEKPRWEALKDHIHGLKYSRIVLDLIIPLVSPNKVAFVDHETRRGLLGRMLTEFLDTRVMVKNSMKLHKGNRVPFAPSGTCLIFLLT